MSLERTVHDAFGHAASVAIYGALFYIASGCSGRHPVCGQFRRSANASAQLSAAVAAPAAVPCGGLIDVHR